MVESPIPVTVAMLTFNAEATVGKALASLNGVAEIVVADGGSTDRTREIVESFGGKVFDQPSHAKDSAGRLIDFGAARDSLRLHATQPWIFELDSDEYATDELMRDLRRVCIISETSPSMYAMFSRYEFRGRIVDCASSYPMVRPRLYLASACTGYEGMTDEIAIVSGDRGQLSSWFVVPYPPVRSLVPKWLRYLKLDRIEAASMDAKALRQRKAFRRSTVRWFLRDYRSKRPKSCTNPLPVHLELLRLAFYAARYGVTIAESARRWLRTRR